MSRTTRHEKTAVPQVTGGIPAHAPDDSVPPRRPVLERILIIFSKLGMAPSDADHRRVPAVLRYLES